MKACISEMTTLNATFADDVGAFAGAGWPAMEVWLTKLETHLQTNSADDTRAMLLEKGIELAAASYQGGLLFSQGDARKAHFDHYRRRLDLCQQFRIPLMNVITDAPAQPDPRALERCLVSLKQAAQWADGFGVKLALEFRAGDPICSCLETALMMVDQCGEPNVGVNLDLFHYYTGPSKLEDIAAAKPGAIAFVQACDLGGMPREFATDGDRIMPGDGDFRIDSVLDAVKQNGYDGFVSLELMDRTLWQMKPTQVAELGLMALQRFLSG